MIKIIKKLLNKFWPGTFIERSEVNAILDRHNVFAPHEILYSPVAQDRSELIGKIKSDINKL